MSNPTIDALRLSLNAKALGLPLTSDGISRAMWQQQLDIATATERVTDRQINLLRAQRAVIDDQLDAATRKRDDATRQVLAAQKALDGLAAGVEQ